MSHLMNHEPEEAPTYPDRMIVEIEVEPAPDKYVGVFAKRNGQRHPGSSWNPARMMGTLVFFNTHPGGHDPAHNCVAGDVLEVGYRNEWQKFSYEPGTRIRLHFPGPNKEE